MVTILDVAREAGVSKATVSRVIQGATNVLPETRERVESVIKKLNYHPNRLAQQFRGQQTKMILVIIPEIGNAFYADVLSGIEQVAMEDDYTTLLVYSHGSASIESKCYGMLTQKLVDGIITFSIGIPKDELKNLAAQYPIVVGCRYFADGSIANVTIDNSKATKDMTNHMLNLGHKRICCLAGPEEVPIYQDRVRGYLEALRERNIPYDEKLILHCDPSVEGAYKAVFSFLDHKGKDFSAIVAGGDTMAIGALRALNEHQIIVPKDVAISGFDDIPLASLTSPALTTVRQPKERIGVRSAEKLLELISGSARAASRDILNYELVIRESSGNFIGNQNQY